MTLANRSYSIMLTVAKEAGCMGVEIRDDLDGKLFDGVDATRAGRTATSLGLRLLALSEVSAFNDLSDRAYQDLHQLSRIASECGAEAVSLIPRNDGLHTDPVSRKRCLKETLESFAPVLERYNVLGYIEPLGFEQCSLRYKSDVVELLEELELTDRFKLVHDTFHHHLAGNDAIFPTHTGIVHVSGVSDGALTTSQMRDEHRILINAADVLNNVGQLSELQRQGFNGPISIEAFSPEVHQMDKPTAALSECFSFIEMRLDTTSTRH